VLGPHLGYRHDAKTIAFALGAEKRTDHFVLHYRSDGPFGKEIADVAAELEFRYERLAALLGVAPDRRVHAYLFASAAEKQALMGAGHTYIAKPWRNELYVNYEPFPQSVLGHELAHVFGASVGDPLLGLARRGMRLDVGLIEGLAEAVAPANGSLTADEVVRVLTLLGRPASLDAVMSPRFWSLPPQQAYAIAGSFCRFLIDRNGAPALLALYRAGGDRAAYPSIFGASFASLEAEWHRKIEAVAIDPVTLERERDRILRPSIFRRPCARELARLVELARARAAANDHPGARAAYEQVCADEPDDPGHLDELLVETARGGNEAEARKVADRLLRHPKASASQRGAAHAVLADLETRAGHEAAAAHELELAQAFPIDEASARLYTVKRLLAARLADPNTPTHDALRRALLALSRAGADPASDYTELTRASDEAPTDALLAYLAARQLDSHLLYREADGKLLQALAGPLPDDRFVREAERLRAELSFRLGAYPTAILRFEALAERGTPAARANALLWAARARFFLGHSHGR
jgi:hypothetical protein